MSFQLNDPVGLYKDFYGPYYREFYGRYNQQMPLLIADDRVPISVYGVMNRRVEILKFAWWDKYIVFNEEAVRHRDSFRDSWLCSFFVTGDGAVRHSDGRMKVVLDAQYLSSLTLETKLVDNAVPLTDEIYNGLDGEEFTAKDVKRYFNRPLSKKEAEENPGWRALLRGDKELQKEAVGATFARVKQKSSYGGKMMGFYHSAVPSEGAAGRVWFVGGLEYNPYREQFYQNSWVSGNHLLINASANVRLIAVPPEAINAFYKLKEHAK